MKIRFLFIAMAFAVISCNKEKDEHNNSPDTVMEYFDLSGKEIERFNGWIELSFDSNAQKIILHKATISTIAVKEIKVDV